jgi:hypothetical protein
MNPTTDTPRTDAIAIVEEFTVSDDYEAMRNHARVLEREITALRAHVFEMENALRVARASGTASGESLARAECAELRHTISALRAENEKLAESYDRVVVEKNKTAVENERFRASDRELRVEVERLKDYYRPFELGESYQLRERAEKAEKEVERLKAERDSAITGDDFDEIGALKQRAERLEKALREYTDYHSPFTGYNSPKEQELYDAARAALGGK